MFRIVINYYPGIKCALVARVSLRHGRVVELGVVKDPKFNNEGQMSDHGAILGRFGTDIDAALKCIHQRMEEAALQVDGGAYGCERADEEIL